jgi:hypothetical protein
MSFPSLYNGLINEQAQLLNTLATYQENGTNYLASTLTDRLKLVSDTGCDLALQAIRSNNILKKIGVKAIQATSSAEDDIAEWMQTRSNQVPSDIIDCEKLIAQSGIFATTTNICNLPKPEQLEILNDFTNLSIITNQLALKYTSGIFSRIISALQLILASFSEYATELYNQE